MRPSRSAVNRLDPPKSHHARVILEDLAAAMRAASANLRGSSVLDLGSGSSPYRTLFTGFDRYVTADLPGEGSDLVIENGRVPADDGTFDGPARDFGTKSSAADSP